MFFYGFFFPSDREMLELTTWSLRIPWIPKLGGGLKYFLCSPRKLGKMSIWTNIFQMG